MALKTAGRDPTCALSRGFVEDQYRAVVESLIIAFLAPRHSAECAQVATSLAPGRTASLWPAALADTVDRALVHHSDWLDGVLARDRLTRMFSSSFVLQCSAEDVVVGLHMQRHLLAKDGTLPVVQLVETLHALCQPSASSSSSSAAAQQQ